MTSYLTVGTGIQRIELKIIKIKRAPLYNLENSLDNRARDFALYIQSKFTRR